MSLTRKLVRTHKIMENSECAKWFGVSLTIFPPIRLNYQISVESLSALSVSPWALVIVSQVCALLCIHYVFYIFWCDELRSVRWIQTAGCPFGSSFLHRYWSKFLHIRYGLTDVSFPRNCIAHILSNYLFALCIWLWFTNWIRYADFLYINLYCLISCYY